jgi:hypothetical protein
MALAGTVWNIKLFMESTNSVTVNSRAVYEFTITITDECTLDVVTTTATINDFTYFIGGSSIVVEPTYS